MKHILFLLLSFLCLTAYAQNSDFPPRPNPSRLVNDMADMLSAEEEQALEQKLVNYSDTTSTQITVVTLNSIGGYDANQYAAELGERWGVGTGENDNGLVILIAKEERKVAIQTGYGMEEYVPDAIAKRITERTLKPNFQQEAYYKGLDEATSLIIGLASGAFQGDPTAANRGGEEEGGPSIIFIIIIVILVVFIISRRGGGRGGRGRRGYSRTFGGPIIVPGGFGTFRSGGGMFGGGGGGGGFGGFGGGSFGGGGASSSW